MFTTEQAQQLMGSTAVDAHGNKIGKIGQIYLDDQSGQPEWVSINTGLLGSSESLAPLEGATVAGDGLRLAYSKDQVKDAPSVDADQHLSPEEEQRLYAHYGMDFGTGYDVDATSTTTTTGAVDRTGSDDAMTLSKEQLRVGTERREVGRARLRKHVITQQETVTVPVTREEARIEREPITPDNIDKALAGPEIHENVHEVVLTEERPVVTKETVPVERVRLETETHTEQETVTEEVRRERIETEGVEGTPRI